MDNNQERKKILFISSEMRPFLDGDTPLAEIARYLPQKIQEKDNEVRILVPRFGVINERRNRLHEVVRLSGMNITIDDNLRNIDAARELGIQSIHFENPDQLEEVIKNYINN